MKVTTLLRLSWSASGTKTSRKLNRLSRIFLNWPKLRANLRATGIVISSPSKTRRLFLRCELTRKIYTVGCKGFQLSRIWTTLWTRPYWSKASRTRITYWAKRHKSSESASRLVKIDSRESSTSVKTWTTILLHWTKRSSLRSCNKGNLR